MFESSIIGEQIDLFLDYKAEGLSGNAKDVQKARSFYALLKKNASRLKLLIDFSHVKNVVQMKEIMSEWQTEAKNGNSVTYFIYPHGSDTCVGCFRVHRHDNIAETAVWIDENETGKGYMQSAGKMIEDALFDKGIQEIVRRVYLKNPYYDVVKHNIEKAGYKPCAFKSFRYKAGDEAVFTTFHKTLDMYQMEQKSKDLGLITKGLKSIER